MGGHQYSDISDNNGRHYSKFTIILNNEYNILLLLRVEF